MSIVAPCINPSLAPRDAPILHLTSLLIERLQSEKQTDFSDDTLPGFSLRVGKHAKTFMLLVGTAQGRKRIKIGRYNPPHFTLAHARAKARELIGLHQSHRDTSDILVTDALDRFFEQCVRKNKPVSVRETTRLLR